jgi:hypothetical protein
MEEIGGGVRWFLRSGLRWAILALLIVAFLWFVPQLQGEYFSQKVPAKERPALVNEYRRTWAQIIGGFGLLLDYLEALLRTLAADSERLADPDALREIRAGQLAIIYGTLFDRTLRVLELAPAFLRSGP